MNHEINHPAYPEEKGRLDLTISAIKKTIETLEGKKSNFLGSWSDRMVALQLMEMDTAMARHLDQSVRQPYFARIDILEIQRAEQLKLYIGKTGFAHHDPTVQIIDWRAPVAELYYGATEEMASYTAPGGVRKAKILLRRKFDIQEGKLLAIFDEKIVDVIRKERGKKTTAKKTQREPTVTDEFLNYKLQGHVDNKLKDIVATIQKEQNRIIRAPKDQVVIVQGAAGSGKTTVALHRLSYLVYHNQESFFSDRLLIIAPNRIFLDYISDVLPELGVDRVRQDTFEGMAVRLLGTVFKTNETEKIRLLLEKAVPGPQGKIRQKLLLASRYKASLDYKRLIDSYIDYFRGEFGKKLQDIVLEKAAFRLPAENLIVKLENTGQPLVTQIARLKEFVTDSLNTHLYGDKGYRQGQIARIKESFSHRIAEMRLQVTDEKEAGNQSRQLMAQRDQLIAEMEKEKQTLLATYFKGWPQPTALGFYSRMLGEPKILKNLAPGEADFLFLSRFYKSLSSDNQLEREDLAPLLYLKYRLNGLSESNRYLHIIVDEAQDLTAFEYEILKILSENNSFTVVGDMAQSIHDFRGINDWQTLSAQLQGQAKGRKKPAFFQMELSYRSTMEIIYFANAILEKSTVDLPPAKPVIRHGSLPELIRSADDEAMMAGAAEKIAWAIKRGYKSIAVICKTAESCGTFYRFLGRSSLRMDVNLITEDQTGFARGISIVPVFLAKGLEFDVVCLFDASAGTFSLAPTEIKLLYVAATRALHHLSVFYKDEPAPAIAGMSRELYVAGTDVEQDKR